MSDKLKVGIIGTGLIGKSHVRGYQSMPNDVEIVAVADIDESEAQRVAQEHDIPHTFSNYRDLLNIDEIDSVDVCLPQLSACPSYNRSTQSRKARLLRKTDGKNRFRGHRDV